MQDYVPVALRTISFWVYVQGSPLSALKIIFSLVDTQEDVISLAVIIYSLAVVQVTMFFVVAKMFI